MLSKYSAFLDVIWRGLRMLLALLAALMTAIMMYQVILRYCFNDANIWAEEVTRYLFVWVTMLGSGVAIRANVHLRIDFLVDALSLKPRLILQMISYLLILMFLLYLCVLGFDLMDNTWVNRSAGLRIPMAIPYTALPVGGMIMILFCTECIFKKTEEIRQVFTGQFKEADRA
jgi:TRAP-type C4-dicarboxylate transport system permease small subunit